MDIAFWQTSWFMWAVGLAVGFPLAVVVLGEVVAHTRKSRPAVAKTVRFIRDFVVPLIVGLLFLTQVLELNGENVYVRFGNTVVLIAVIAAALFFVNAVIFGAAPAQSWRSNVPRLLRDLVLLLLVGLGAAFVLSAVWGFDLAALITAFGLGSIVLGLALQDTLGSIMTGVALLAERPFSEGDWVEIGDVEGRIEEINWRAVRLETHYGDTVVVPHLIAGREIIVNNSQPSAHDAVRVRIGFDYAHPPNQVKAALRAAAGSTEGILAKPQPRVLTADYGDSQIVYEIVFWIASVEVRPMVRERFLTRVWYAAQRNRLTIPFPIRTVYNYDAAALAKERERSMESMVEGVSVMVEGSGDGAAPGLVRESTLQHFGAGERIIRQGLRTEALYIMVDGEASMTVGGGSETQEVARLTRGEFFGEMTFFAGGPSPVTVVAATDVQALALPTSTVLSMIEQRPAFARELSELVDHRRQIVASLRRTNAG